MRHLRGVISICIVAFATATSAQTVTFPNRSNTVAGASLADSLSIKDILDMRTVSVADLSRDGRWRAITVNVRRDGLGVDFSRDGDPTYLRSQPAELLVVDTKSLAQRPVFRTKTTVRSVSWSPDASRLAMFVVTNESQQLQVWDRASGKV